MIIDNKVCKITEKLIIENYTNNELEFSSLLSLSDISKWSTNNVTIMSYIFFRYSLL